MNQRTLFDIPAPRIAGDELFPDEAPEIICRECGATLAAPVNEHRLCDSCLVSYVNGAGELEYDELPKAPRPTAALTATTCRVCAVGRVATLASAKLCPDCLSNLDATKLHVEQVLVNAMAHVERAADAWQHTLCAVDDAVLARFRKAEQLLESGKAKTTPGFFEIWARETQQQTPLGQILLAYETYQTALQALREYRDWATAAAVEIGLAQNEGAHQ